MPDTAPNTMYQDLLACQSEMPNLQKTAINPHFKSKFVPLEELISKVVPILNAHNFVLVQAPAFHENQPALVSSLIHVSGETITTTMPLLCAKDDPQGQGSAITYARRYSLMAMLGLSADEDDDAEKATSSAYDEARRSDSGGARFVHQSVPRPAPRGGQERPSVDGAPIPPPQCEHHGDMAYRKAGVSGPNSREPGKPYAAFYGCTERTCKTRGINAGDWAEQYRQMQEPAAVGVDHGDLPDE